MGLSFGVGPCNITCLPYLGPVFITEGRRWQRVGLFSAGRLSGYTLLGTAAGFFGQALEQFFAAAWGTLLLGIATLLMGVALWRKVRVTTCHVAAHSETQPVSFIPAQSTPHRGNGSLFLMGLGLALNPCTPLSALLLAATATQSALTGGSLGLGAVLVPPCCLAFSSPTSARRRTPIWRSGNRN